MEIRAITFFTALPPGAPADDLGEHLSALGHQARQVEALFKEAGHPVQSLRLATQPLEQLLPDSVSAADLAAFARRYEAAAVAAGFRHVALGTLGAADDAAKDRRVEELLRGLPGVIGATDWVFSSVQLASRARGLNARALPLAARVVLDNAPQKKDGFGNLRFCMVANMPPFSPFFPAAWHDGSSPAAFAIAIEAADRVAKVIEQAHDPWSAGPALTEQFDALGATLDTLSKRAAEVTGLDYRGIDMTPSPYPSVPRCLGRAVELITGEPFGAPGTLAAVGLIKGSLRRARFTKAGYCGVMLLPLEDAVLAERARQGRYDISTLFACAGVGATGLDVIPLAGDVPVAWIEGLMRDTAELALTLDAPLTVRLLPVPGLAQGETTQFDFDYFASTTAFAMPGG